MNIYEIAAAVRKEYQEWQQAQKLADDAKERWRTAMRAVMSKSSEKTVDKDSET